MRQLWRESKQISVWREKQLVMEKFSEILQPHVHSRCLPTLQIPERALFARFNVSFKRGEHYRNWSINPLPLTSALWIANSCRFHVEVLGTTCHKSSVVHKSQSPRVLLTKSSSFNTNPIEQLIYKSSKKPAPTNQISTLPQDVWATCKRFYEVLLQGDASRTSFSIYLTACVQLIGCSP